MRTRPLSRHLTILEPDFLFRLLSVALTKADCSITADDHIYKVREIGGLI